MVAELQGRTLAGAYAIGNGSVEACSQVLRRCNGNSKKFIALAGFPLPAQMFTTYVGTALYFVSTMWWMGSTAVMSYFTGVTTKFIDGKDLCKEENVVSRLVYQDFLPLALASRQFVPAPEPLVVGRGLDKIQEALNIQQKGVSAQKVVVLL